MADTPSLADSLRETRKHLTEQREPKLFELPGYGKKLQVKYETLSREARKEILRGVAARAKVGEDRAAEMGMCNTLARGCLAFYTLRDGEVVLLNEAEGLGDEHIKWGDRRLAEMFGMEVAGEVVAREVIEFVLGTDDVLEEHHNEVSRWMEQSWEADDADF